MQNLWSLPMDQFHGQGRIMNADMAISLPKKVWSHMYCHIVNWGHNCDAVHVTPEIIAVIHCWDQNVPGCLYLGLNKGNP